MFPRALIYLNLDPILSLGHPFSGYNIMVLVLLNQQFPKTSSMPKSRGELKIQILLTLLSRSLRLARMSLSICGFQTPQVI